MSVIPDISEIDKAIGWTPSSDSTDDISSIDKAIGWKPPKSVSPLSRDEDLAVRTVIGEAKNQGQRGWQAVAGVIRNRAKGAGQTFGDVVLAPNQFEPWGSRKAELNSIDPNSAIYRKVADTVLPVLRGDAPDPTGGATHFYAPKAQAALGRKPPAWDNGTGIDIGDHRFFKLGYHGTGKSRTSAPITAGNIPNIDKAIGWSPTTDLSEIDKAIGWQPPDNLLRPGEPLAPDVQQPAQPVPVAPVAPPVPVAPSDVPPTVAEQPLTAADLKDVPIPTTPQPDPRSLVTLPDSLPLYQQAKQSVLANVDPSKLLGGARVSPKVAAQTQPPTAPSDAFSGQVINPATTSQEPVSSDLPPETQAVTNKSDAELRQQAVNSFGGKGTPEQIDQEFQNLKTQQEDAKNNAVADTIHLDSWANPRDAAEQALRKIAPKYGLDAEDLLKRNPDMTAQPDENGNVGLTYGNLKTAGIDADALMRERSLQEKTANPTPALGAPESVKQLPTFSEFIRQAPSELPDFAKKALFSRDQNNQLTDTAKAQQAYLNASGEYDKQIGEGIKEALLQMSPPDFAVPGVSSYGGTTGKAAIGSFVSDLMQFGGGLMDWSVPGIINDFVTGQDYGAPLAQLGNRVEKINEASTPDTQVYKMVAVPGDVLGKLPGYAIATAAAGGNPILGFALHDALVARGKTGSDVSAIGAGAQGALMGAALGPLRSLGEMASNGLLGESMASAVKGVDDPASTAFRKLIEKGVPVGLATGLGYGQSAAQGGSTEENLKNALLFGAMEWSGGMLHKAPGEALTPEDVSKLDGSIIRVPDENGKPVTVALSNSDGELEVTKVDAPPVNGIVLPAKMAPHEVAKTAVDVTRDEIKKRLRGEVPTTQSESAPARDTTDTSPSPSANAAEVPSDAKAAEAGRQSAVQDQTVAPEMTGGIFEHPVLPEDPFQKLPRAEKERLIKESGAQVEAQLKAEAAKPVVPTIGSVTHPNPEIDGRPIVARTDEGKVVVPNEGNKSGVSVVTDHSGEQAGKPAEATTLPDIGSNHIRPLSDFTPTLYRETNADKALDLLLHANKDDQPYFANTPNLAKGQGANKGVIVELTSDGLQGQVNRSKPGADLTYKNGEAEFVGKYNDNYADNIQKVTITSEAKGQKKASALGNTLEQRGFTKTVQPNGDIVFEREARPVTESSSKGFDIGNPEAETRAKAIDSGQETIAQRDILPTAEDLVTTDEKLGSQSTGNVERPAPQAAGDTGSKGDTTVESGQPPGTEAPKAEAPAVPETGAEPERGVGFKGKPSKVGKDIEAKTIAADLTKGFEGTAEYDPITVKDQAEKAAKLVNTDLQTARDYISGKQKLPADLRAAPVIDAMERLARKDGDVELLKELANSPLVSETSRYAQELRLLRERQPTSPVKLIEDVQKARQAVAQKRYKNQTVRDVVQQIKKTVPKQRVKDWSSLVEMLKCD